MFTVCFHIENGPWGNPGAMPMCKNLCFHYENCQGIFIELICRYGNSYLDTIYETLRFLPKTRSQRPNIEYYLGNER